MKMLFVARAIYPAEIGGPANTVYQMTKGLIASEVLSSDLGISISNVKKFNLTLDELNRIDGVPVWLFKKGKQSLVSRKMIRWLWGNVTNYELVNLNSFFAPMSLITCIICLIKSVPFTVAPRGELHSPALNNKYLLKKVTFLFYRMVYRKSVAFIVTSDEELGLVRYHIGHDRIVQTVNPYDFTKFNVVDETRKHLLYIGRLNPIKNIEIVLDAYSKYRSSSKSKTLDLVIAGTGEPKYVNELKERARSLGVSDSVFFVGHVTSEQKSYYFNAAKVTILVSKSENFGNVVVESLGHGTPVIASKGTPWKGLEKNNSGYWIEPKVEALLNRINLVTRMDDDEYKKMRADSLSYAVTNFSSEHVLTRFQHDIFRCTKHN